MTKSTAVVLGAAVWQGGAPSPTLYRRANHGAQLYLNGTVNRIVACGGLGKYAPTEAEVIRDICVGAGVPVEAIILEDHSTTTKENIAFAHNLLSKNTEIVIITDAYHATRARLIAKRLGIVATSSSPPPSKMKARIRIKAYLREAAAIILHTFHIQRRKR